MKKLVGISIVVIFSLWSAMSLASSHSPVGVWTTISDKDNKPRAVVVVTKRKGVFYGKIRKVYKRPGDTGRCVKCPPPFKDKKVAGMQIMWGVKKTGKNRWSGGKILDSKTGKIYKVKLSLSDGGKRLKVRGYIGFSLLGRTQTWIRK